MSASDTGTLVWEEVATLDEVWEGETLDVEVDGQVVLVAHLRGGTVVAYQGMCPHQAIALVDGAVDEDAGTLTCSAHAWEFDLRDGKGLNPTGCDLYRYQARIDGEKILVGYPEGDRDRYHQSKEED
ncbi:MAG: Toluene-4-monooxygenase system protein [Conexibacter sp.]|nr:Toluene-4-monooxygenase system protein [Conexibacter sp.]